MSLVLTAGRLGSALVCGLAGGAAASIVGMLIARTVTSPIVALTKSAESIANGAGDGQLELSYPGRELAQLAVTFDRMAYALRKDAALAAQQRDTLGAVLTAIADGVVLLDATGHTRLINPAGRRLLGVESSPPEGRSFSELADDREVAALANRALRGEAADTVLELGKSRRTLQIHAAPLSAGEPGAVLLLHDLTELRRLDRVRQEFVANASHELLTPIGTVRVLADTLAHGGLADKKTARRFLRRLQMEADRLTVLVRDLLDLAQAQSGELRLTLAETDPRQVIATVAERMQARAAKAGITLDSSSEDDLPPVLADATRLEQVLMNLVQNATKFTPEGGNIQITATTTADEVVLRVIDSGVGIAAEDLPRVFERFYKVRGAGSRSSGGTGLGLAIARHLVQAMHGRIWAESEIGRGSTFSVTLLRADPAAAEAATALPSIAGASSGEPPPADRTSAGDDGQRADASPRHP